MTQYKQLENYAFRYSDRCVEFLGLARLLTRNIVTLTCCQSTGLSCKT
jgi:hypothetical protein